VSYFNAEHKNIGNLFDFYSNKNPHSDPNRTSFYTNWVVPNYQRKYAWKDKHLNDFWEDLNSDRQQTFFGTFLIKIHKDSSSLESCPEHEIIDGQQRLTTITILWGVITNILEELKSLPNLPDEYRDQLTTKILEFEHAYINRKKIRHSGIDKNYFFYIHEEQESIFEQYIKNLNDSHDILRQVYGKNKPEWKIQNAYFFFYKKLLGLNEDFSLKKFNNLPSNTKSYQIEEENFLTDSKYFKMLSPPYPYDDYMGLLEDSIEAKFRNLMSVIIEIQDEELAFEYFESVNAKGEDLSVADLLKNLVLKNISDIGQRNTAEELWNETIDKILSFDTKNGAVLNFFSYYWTSKHGYVPIKQLYTDIKDRTKEYSGDEWIDFAQNILLYAEIYSNLLDKDVQENEFKRYFLPRRNLHKKLFRSIQGLRSTNTQLWTVIVMTLLANKDYFKAIPNGSSTAFFPYEKVLDVLEKFIFTYNVVGKGPANVIHQFVDEFSSQLRSWVDNNTEFSNVQSELYSSFYSKINKKIPTRSEFIKNVKENVKYKKSTIAMCHYYLHEIERIKFGNTITAEATVEHIIPRTPKKWRLKAKDVPRLHHIGNLILLESTLNSGGAGNKIFNEKVEIYERSTYAQVTNFIDEYNDKYDFSTITRTDMTAVENRDDIIANIMADIWVDKLDSDTSG